MSRTEAVGAHLLCCLQGFGASDFPLQAVFVSRELALLARPTLARRAQGIHQGSRHAKMCIVRQTRNTRRRQRFIIPVAIYR